MSSKNSITFPSIKLYKVLTILLFPVIVIYMLIRFIKGKENITSILEKLTIRQKIRSNKTIIWFHAASVGELNLASSFIKIITNNRTDVQCLVTTITLSSAKIFEVAKLKNTMHQFLPLDISFIINNFLNHWNPKIAVFTESELWPNIINQSTKKRIPLLLFNARLSDISYKRWKKFRNFASNLLQKFSLIFTASKLDYSKFSTFTQNNIKFIGHFKYSSPTLSYSKEYVKILKEKLKYKNIFVAVSTHKGEEEIIIETHKVLKAYIKNLCTIIIPRHPHRISELKRIFTHYHINFITDISDLKKENDLLLVGAFGVFGNFFQLAEIIFVGGSLVNIGGHNILEPAKQNSAIIVGPHTSNFKEIVEEFQKAKAISVVKNAKEFQNELLKLFQKPAYKNQLILNSKNILKKHNNITHTAIKIIYNYL